MIEAERVPCAIVVAKPDPINVTPFEFGEARLNDARVFTLTQKDFDSLISTLIETGRYVGEADRQLDYYASGLSACSAGESAVDATVTAAKP